MDAHNIQPAKKKDWMLPASIVLAALLVAGALVYNVGKKDEGAQANLAGSAKAAVPENVAKVTADDHILGDANAPVKIIVFSDFECPFCKTFHETVTKLSSEYKGQVAWIFRQFPLPIHPKAKQEAVASECAAELGGNDAFWKFADRIFAITPSNNGLDPAELPNIARYIGLDATKFNKCLTSGKYDAKIAAQSQDGNNAGLQGTPYSVAIAANGQVLAINGAQPYDYVKAVIDEVLKAGK